MLQFISFFLAFIFQALALIHIYWGLGGQWGGKLAIPTGENDLPVFRPGRAACIMVAAALLAFSAIVLSKSRVLNLMQPVWINDYGVLLLSILFLVRAIGDFKYVGFFKKLKHSRFANMDTKYYSPLCVLISVMCLLLKLGH